MSSAASSCPGKRLAQLLDTGAPFLEIGQFAAWGMYSRDIASAGLIAGIGRSRAAR